MRKIYSVYDEQSRTFGPLVYGNTDEEILRSVSNVVNNPNPQPGDFIATNPEDYTLYFIGNITEGIDASGSEAILIGVVSGPHPRPIINLRSLKRTIAPQS